MCLANAHKPETPAPGRPGAGASGLRAGAKAQAREPELFADVRHEGHEASAFDGVLDGALEGGAIAAALAAEQFALAGAELLERLHVLVIHECRPRAALLRAEPAAILAATTKLLTNH